MKFEESLLISSNDKIKITRESWPYYLKFNGDGYLILHDHHGEISPYTIAAWDFNYEWKIVE